MQIIKNGKPVVRADESHFLLPLTPGIEENESALK